MAKATSRDAKWIRNNLSLCMFSWGHIRVGGAARHLYSAFLLGLEPWMTDQRLNPLRQAQFQRSRTKWKARAASREHVSPCRQMNCSRRIWKADDSEVSLRAFSVRWLTDVLRDRHLGRLCVVSMRVSSLYLSSTFPLFPLSLSLSGRPALFYFTPCLHLSLLPSVSSCLLR